MRKFKIQNLFILGYQKIAKMLVENGANVNQVNNNGMTTLHMAVWGGKFIQNDIYLNNKIIQFHFCSNVMQIMQISPNYW